MSVITNCKHEFIEFHGPFLKCKSCGKELDIKNINQQEIALLLKNLPEYHLTHREPANISCYSPVQQPLYHNYSDLDKKSGCSIKIGHIIIILIVGLVIYLLIHFLT